MAKLYPITLYYNTKYNTGNIPDSPARLQVFASETFTPVYLRQDYGLASVKIDATWQQVMDADYAMLESAEGSTYWVIPEPPRMLTDHTAQISLVLDPLTTVGGIGAITIDSGWAVRAHVTDDEMYSNILPEPWAPSNKLVIRGKITVHDNADGKYYPFAATTCDLMALKEYKADVYKAADEAAEGLDVVVPHVPEVKQSNGTVVGYDRPSGSGTESVSYTLPGIYLWSVGTLTGGGINEVMREALALLNSLGLNNSLLALYMLRDDDINAVGYAGTTYEPLMESVKGARKTETVDLPYRYTEVRNNKTLALYNTYTLVSNASGNEMSYDSADLYKAGDTSPTLAVIIDPSPNGTVYIGPVWYEGAPTVRLEQCVAGLPWINAGYTFASQSGSDLGILNAQRRNNRIRYDANYAQQTADLEYGAEQLGRLVNGIRDVGNIATGAIAMATPLGALALPSMGNAALDLGNQIIGGVKASYMHGREQVHREQTTLWTMGDNLFDARVSANVVAPELAFPVSASSAAYYGNSATMYHITLSDNDVKRLDDFLSAYGYARDTKLVPSMLSNRTNHNYIKTSGAMVSAQGFPRWICDSIGAMFDAGVQIWHTTPSLTALYDNPVRSN